MMPSRYFLLVLFTTLFTKSSGLVYRSSLEEQEIEVTTNPYGPGAESCSSVQNLLSPHLLMTQTLPTQMDTFRKIRHAKVLTQPVPVYTMQQPERLSPRQLSFDLVLVRDLASHEQVHVVPVDPEKGMDSWFPGYSWEPLVHDCGGSYQHVGWKFTSNDSSFYALLVHVDERRQKNPIRVGGFQAAGWMLQGIKV